jgi:hypothetical protein
MINTRAQNLCILEDAGLLHAAGIVKPFSRRLAL